MNLADLTDFSSDLPINAGNQSRKNIDTWLDYYSTKNHKMLWNLTWLNASDAKCSWQNNCNVNFKKYEIFYGDKISGPHTQKLIVWCSIIVWCSTNGRMMRITAATLWAISSCLASSSNLNENGSICLCVETKYQASFYISQCCLVCINTRML